MSARKDTFLLRVYIILMIFTVLGFGVVFRIWQIGITQHEQWVEEGKKMFVKRFPISAERGDILSDDGSLLATELQFFDIYMDFRAGGISDIVWERSVDSLAILFSRHLDLGKDYREIKNWLIGKRNAKDLNRFVPIKMEATFEELKLIKSFPLLRRGQHGGGLIVRRDAKRVKPYGQLASRTIGISRLNASPVGLEDAYEEQLAGDAGSQLMHKTTNAFLPIENVGNIEPRRGSDVVTTLDVNIQDITENALLKSLNKHSAEYGVAIVMEVKTGAIKAIANLGKTKSGEFAEIYNYAVGTATEPGSTMKLASILVMLDDGLLSSQEMVDLHRGKLKLCNETLHDSEHHDMREVTAQMAFEMSSNVGIAQLVRRHYLGKEEKFIEGLERLGLFKKTHIEIVGEAKPHIKHPDKDPDWSCTTMPWTAIGYEMTITPLQMLALYNAVANDGKAMKPFLVSRIEKLGVIEQEFQPVVVNRKIASRQAIRTAKEFLEGVVLRGTARKLRSEQYSFAAKTGTSIVGMDEGRKVYQASIAGYFPAENPKYSCIVLVNDPKVGGYYGGIVAGPVMKEISDKIHASHLEMKAPIVKTEVEFANNGMQIMGNAHEIAFLLDEMDYKLHGDAGGDWINAKAIGDSVLMKNINISSKRVPDVRGLALKDAIYILENIGLKVRFAGLGKVKQQSITPGTELAEQEILLKLG